MFHRLWTLIRKELQSLLREPQTRAILILPVLIQVILFPFAATLEVTRYADTDLVIHTGGKFVCKAVHDGRVLHFGTRLFEVLLLHGGFFLG